MSTRQRSRWRLRALLPPVLCIALSAYFVFEAAEGSFGTQARARIADQIAGKEQELAALVIERQFLTIRNELLRGGTVQQDMLEEQARRMLGLIGDGDLVLLDEPQ